MVLYHGDLYGLELELLLESFVIVVSHVYVLGDQVLHTLLKLTFEEILKGLLWA